LIGNVFRIDGIGEDAIDPFIGASVPERLSFCVGLPVGNIDCNDCHF
jgi:hypothetical protein